MATHVRFTYDEDDETLVDAVPLACQAPASAPAQAPARYGHAGLRLAQTVVTAFNPADDACYVLDIAASGDDALVACSLSNFTVKLYDRGGGALRHVRDWRGHRGPVTHLSFPLAEAPAVALTASADGAACFWDARAATSAPAARFAHRGAAPPGELCAAAVGGPGDVLLAAAGDAGVLLYDRRGGAAAPPLAAFTEAHSEPVAAAAFHPTERNALVTGGVDGLACVFDCGGAADEEEALTGVLSVGSSVARLGFCAAGGAALWALTSTEELSLWSWADAERIAAVPDTRAAASAAAAAAGGPPATSLGAIDYLIRCEWDASAAQLWLLAGTQAGAVGAFPVSADGAALGAPGLCLVGGHADVVRAVEWRPERGPARGALTGGEDSRLCAWAVAAPPVAPAPSGSGSEGARRREGPPGAARRSPSSDSQRYSPY